MFIEDGSGFGGSGFTRSGFDLQLEPLGVPLGAHGPGGRHARDTAAGFVEAIGITASIGSPVKRTVLATARSSVRLDPARNGVPGSETRPSVPSSHSTAPIL